MGGAPKPVVRWAFQLSSVQKLVTKPLAVAKNLDDTEFLAQLEAVDRFTDNMIAYPGRTFGQLYHRFIKGNQLREGSMDFGDRTIRLSSIRHPVLVFAGATDGIAPVSSVRAVVPMLTGARETRFEIVPGGHLGMLTGRAARTSTWQVLDEWIEQWSDAEPRATRPTRARTRTTTKAPARKTGAKTAGATKTPAKKTGAKKAAATKTPAKKAPARKAPARKSAANREAIGANTARRYSSAGSRALAR
jgi:polyhydroxyalkanoate synthase